MSNKIDLAKQMAQGNAFDKNLKGLSANLKSTNPLTNKTMRQFFSRKSYLPKWNFNVLFTFNTRDIIFDHHIVDITIPQYKTKTITTMFGPVPRQFPVIDNDNGFQIPIVFEDDRTGNILRWINEMQGRIVNQNGYHKVPRRTKLGNIVVTLRNYEDREVCQWKFPEVFYISASDVQLSYSANESSRYTVTFGSEIMEYIPIAEPSDQRLNGINNTIDIAKGSIAPLTGL